MGLQLPEMTQGLGSAAGRGGSKAPGVPWQTQSFPHLHTAELREVMRSHTHGGGSANLVL